MLRINGSKGRSRDQLEGFTVIKVTASVLKQEGSKRDTQGWSDLECFKDGAYQCLPTLNVAYERGFADNSTCFSMS